MSTNELNEARRRRISDPRGTPDLVKLYARSAWNGIKLPDLSDLQYFCFFLGYPRSGSSMIGSLLNAHSRVTISHELHALRYVRRRFSRAQIFALILQRDAEFAEVGRIWSDSDYSVPGQHQGQYDGMRVIGDKRAGATSMLLGENPDLLVHARKTMKVPIRVIHVTRNPFDIVASQVHRTKKVIPDRIEWFEKCSAFVAAARRALGPDELIDMSHEDFVADPTGSLATLCRFLGVDTDAGYLKACASVVWPSAKRSRDSIEWSPEDREFIETVIGRHDFLAQYTFDN